MTVLRQRVLMTDAAQETDDALSWGNAVAIAFRKAAQR